MKNLLDPEASMHSLVLLGNLEDRINSLSEIPGLENLQGVYQTQGINDLAVVGNMDLYSAIQAISHTQGVISSRTLILYKQTEEKGCRASKNHGLLLIDCLAGKEDSVLSGLASLDEIYKAYQSRGLYDTVALVSYDDEEEFKKKVNALQDIRSADLLRTKCYITPIDVIQDSQTIRGAHYNTKNRYELDYANNQEINIRYAQGCKEMARGLINLEKEGAISMIYAPIRGAKPIVDLMMEFYRRLQEKKDYFSPRIHYPVTSSFVLYPGCHKYTTKKGKMPASGRKTNILELERIKARCPEELGNILYVDEIISGGMMVGHTKEMISPSMHAGKRGVITDMMQDGLAKLNVFGLVHDFGSKFGDSKKNYFLEENRRKHIRFERFNVPNLITEDRRFLLGMHYLVNELGPHVIPFIESSREYPAYKAKFWEDVKREIEGI